MARQFLTVTQEEIDLKIAEAIRARELELLAYDFEATSHEATIAGISAEEQTGDTRYRGLDRDRLIQAVITDGGDQARLRRVADLEHRTRAVHSLEAVRIETAKSERFLQHLLEQLPEGRRQAAFNALKEKEARDAERK